MIKTLDQFIAELPNFISDANHLVVATYNNLDSHRESCEIDTPGRKISILCGRAAYANTVRVLYTDVATPTEEVQRSKTIGVETISQRLQGFSSGSCAILYAGMSRFNEIAEIAYQLGRQGVKVALVSCGCNPHVFDRLTRHDNVLLVMPQHEVCNGGRFDLSLIVSRLIR